MVSILSSFSLFEWSLNISATISMSKYTSYDWSLSHIHECNIPRFQINEKKNSTCSKMRTNKNFYLNSVLCIVLMLDLCVIVMMCIWIHWQCAKTLNHHRGNQRKEKKKRKIQIQILTHICLWPLLQILNLCQFDLCQWFGNTSKHFRTPLESNKLKSNQNIIQNELTWDNGQNCKLYHDTYFEPLY
jgi:hypothetical protein